ncbi:phosphotransferase [Paenibacillus agilis]|uniref:Phosphotransferase n=1 Tax=Paenibacillus agilis TaxID=3020863 RepID=A0A559J008_9BACL|nr:phosphotransferase [Paenibacillus agilis]TVX93204.1 phosphotransferase [Paenibacillus agilis]
MITEKQLEYLLQFYYKDTIKSFRVIDNSGEDEYRYVAIINTLNNGPIVLKCYSNPYTSSEKIDGWAHLARTYRNNGIPTPAFYHTRDGKYSITHIMEGHLFYVWAEQYMSEKTLDDLELELEQLEDDFLHQLGSCVGKMHSISLQNDISYSWDSAYVLFDEEEENYDYALQWYEGLKDTEADTHLLEEIWSIYNEKRAELQSVYSTLPAGAVQGDLSTNNLLVDHHHRFSGIIDYNLAGNEKFVTYMIQEGIFLCYECYEEEWLDTERCRYMDQRFKQFYEGYKEHYSITDAERNVITILYNMIRPFRGDKVETTLRKVEEGSWQEVNERLQWMYREITRDDIVLFLES